MKNKEPQIQIPKSLFIDLVKFHLLQVKSDEDKIRSELQKKMEALEKRELYSVYKDSSLSPEEREEARLKYLDSIGLNDEWRW